MPVAISLRYAMFNLLGAPRIEVNDMLTVTVEDEDELTVTVEDEDELTVTIEEID